MASATRPGKSASTFDVLSSGATRHLHRRPRLPFYVIGLLALLIAGLFIAITLEDRQLQRDAMHRDVESAATQIGARLATLTETLSIAAIEIGSGSIGENKFKAIAQELLVARPELVRIEYLDTEWNAVWPAARSAQDAVQPESKSEAEPVPPPLDRLGQSRGPLFAPIYGDGQRHSLLLLAVPVRADKQFAGALLARIDLRDLLIHGIASETADRYRLTMTASERALASTSEGAARPDALTYSTPIAQMPSDYGLNASAFQLDSRFSAGALVWAVAALTLVALVSLGALARFTRRQQRLDRALLAEASLRRAIENSVATGLSVFDTNGVIRHVSRSFCQMTGFSETDLIGQPPPFPYWCAERRQDSEVRLRELLAGKSPPGGFEELVQCKDGSRFDARVYGAPLRDENARHIGWLASIANVTEQERARHELAASHERIAGILEASDAAVSVATTANDGLGRAELVFANRAYRDRFGADRVGHARLATQLHDRDSAEIRDEATGHWYDVRMRDIRWPAHEQQGARPARLQIAFDITQRKADEDDARRQQEATRSASRQTTMGEMASSLAHELSPPLAEIADYSEGMLERVRGGRMSMEELLATLEKTSIQAQRASGIIRRIREFVKRSQPHRRAVPASRIVEEAINVATTEATKKGISIVATIDPTLGPLLVDPLLIEQALLNLLQNAIDAMAHATVRRLDIVVRRSLEDGVAEFAVIDRGSGVADEHLPNIFEPFFSTKTGALGMGLNICRSIVEDHRGRLAVHRNPEAAGGMIIRFTLPLAVGADPKAAAMAPSVVK